MKKIPLHWKIIIGLILGIIYSLISSYLGWNKFTINWIDPFGVIFIRLLKFIAVPLVLFSIIAGVSALPDPAKLGRMGAKTLFAYLVTTVAAVSIGISEFIIAPQMRRSRSPNHPSIGHDFYENPESTRPARRCA